EAAARAAQGFVRGGGDDVGVGDGTGILACGHEAGDVGHVDHEPGADGIGNLAHSCPVDMARVGGEAADERLGLVLFGQGLDSVVVEFAGCFVNAVLDGVGLPAGEVGGGAVG